MLLLLLAAFGCLSSPYGLAAATELTVHPPALWTHMVYISGDSSAEAVALLTAAALARGRASPPVHP
jgi:hypothetical protein